MVSSDAKLDHLLGTAARVFAEKGFHPTTMRDLARATGMSLAGMYHYVSGKDELLYLIQERCFARVLAGAEAALGVADDPTERLRRFIHHHIAFFTTHMSEMKVLSHEAQSLSADRVEGINQLKRRYTRLLIGLIRAARPNDPRIDSNVAAYALFGMMNWIYTWYDPSGPVSPQALADQLAGLYLDGLTTPTATPVSHGG